MKNLNQIFNRYLLLFGSLVVLLCVVVFYYPFYMQIRELEHENFKISIHNEADIINYYFGLFIQNAQALSSRTMIRKQLFKYHNNQLSLDKLRDYTQPKFKDGCKVYKNLKWAQRIALNGEIIANYNISDKIEIEDMDDGLTIFNDLGHLSLIIKNMVFHEGVHIGYDIALFDIMYLLKEDHAVFESFKIQNDNSVLDDSKEYFNSKIGEYPYYLLGKLKQDRHSFLIYTRKLLFILILIIIVVISTLTYFTVYKGGANIIHEYKTVNKLLKEKKEQLTISLIEKETLLHEIHHRVKNNMAVISGLLGLQMNSTGNEIAQEALQDSQNRVQSMSMIHETLYRSDTLSAIDLKTYLSELGRTIFQNYSISKEVQFKVEAESIMISVKQASPVGLVVNELITNCLKYALPDDREGEIILKLKLNKENEVELIVSDNGVGIPEGFDLKTADSLGLKLVKVLVEGQLDGSIDMESNNGTKFTIKFNIES
jgi:two-component sensor histidine kinase